MAELAVFSRAPPVAEEAKAEKAPRSKFCAAPRCKKFRAPQESRGSAAAKTIKYAGMAELADALDSGSSEGNFMQVQVLLPAPKNLVLRNEVFLSIAQ